MPTSFPYSSSSAQLAPPLFTPGPHPQPASQKSFSSLQKQEPVHVENEPEPMNLILPETERFDQPRENTTKDVSAKKIHRR